MLRSRRSTPHAPEHGHAHGHGHAHSRGHGRARQPRRASRRAADEETRQRLLDAAKELIAEDGYHRVTVRDICHHARANVAAVNYHFGDKFGLYMDVLRGGIALMTETNEMARVAGEGKPPEEQLRSYITIFLERILGKDRQSWLQKMMWHEMAVPTPALDVIVEEVLQPRIAYMSDIVARLIGCAIDDPRVLRCVGSVFGQCQVYHWNHVRDRLLKDRPITPDRVDELAEHVVAFSLAGIRGLKG